MKHPDRFDKMAEAAQAEMDSYDLRQSIDGRRRVIAAALRSTHALGLEEAKRGWEQRELIAGLPLSKEATSLISGLRAQVHRLTHGEEIESDRICDHELAYATLRQACVVAGLDLDELKRSLDAYTNPNPSRASSAG